MDTAQAIANAIECPNFPIPWIWRLKILHDAKESIQHLPNDLILDIATNEIIDTNEACRRIILRKIS